MGGYGSGNHFQCRKQSLDELLKIDINHLAKNGALMWGKSSSLSWNDFGEPKSSINIFCLEDIVIISFFMLIGENKSIPVKQSIKLAATKCNYGGGRKWFLCPHCNHRIAKLFLHQGLFLCRHCIKLPYRCQQQDGFNRLESKRDKLGAKIFEDYAKNILEKKKCMHWSTFRRLHAQFLEVDIEYMRELLIRDGYKGI